MGSRFLELLSGWAENGVEVSTELLHSVAMEAKSQNGRQALVHLVRHTHSHTLTFTLTHSHILILARGQTSSGLLAKPHTDSVVMLGKPGTAAEPPR